MIKYNLKCKNYHEFESWFSDSKEFERLKNKKLLECIICNSKKIEKSIMSPRVSVIKAKGNTLPNNTHKEFQRVKNDLLKIRSFVEKNFEFVPNKFANKVREIYYDDVKKKNIYGTVSNEEKEELQEEGIDLVSIPWIDKSN